MTTTPNNDGVQGEGNYEAARRFDDAERSFVKKGPVERKAREAADALDGPEGPALEAARREAAEGDPLKMNKSSGARPEHVVDERDPHTEKNLDDGLEETFPASDPVSISPGAD